MRKFETLLLLTPELAADAREAALATLTEVIQKEGGSDIVADHWGMRDLAYPVRKQMRGYYVRLEYTAPAPCVAELERNIRFSENIFKFLTVRLDETAEEAA